MEVSSPYIQICENYGHEQTRQSHPKETVVIAPFKKPSLNPLDPANYHAVSSLSFLGKITERVVAKQLQGFLEDTVALDPFQISFHPSHGMEGVRLAVSTDSWTEVDWCCFFLLDLTTAFNIVNYDLFAHHLANIRVCGITLQWLISFLQGLEQRVAMRERVSPQEAVFLLSVLHLHVGPCTTGVEFQPILSPVCS